jgi:hypothetical protein
MRVHRWIVAAASRLVPREARKEWRDEWEAELQCRAATRERWTSSARGPPPGAIAPEHRRGLESPVAAIPSMVRQALFGRLAASRQSMEPRLVAAGVRTMTLDDVLWLSLTLSFTFVWITLAFGLIAIAMSIFGLYCTVFYAVTQRRMEIGIRTTLEASPRDLFAMVFRHPGRWLLAARSAA